ncbi:2-oxo acid dehydrogenase subunit E2 [Streptomyces sp. NPDC049040]|uniref:2-oxo acid dehydrogenase subunit E2 n=1 Tax=Streptomyces sp. NPDC049040 TaxID=3365593 RepID=UPI00371B88AF
MAELLVPKLNNNDTDYVLTDWLVGDGGTVTAGDPVAVVETSKASEELEADASGTLHHIAPAGARCRPGEAIADVRGGAAPAPAPPAPAQPAGSGPRQVAGPLVTRPAQALIDELGIGAEQVAALGLPVVRRQDVEALRPAAPAAEAAATPAPGPAVGAGRREPIGRVQQGVGRAVDLSHRTVPAAYTVVRMDLGPALAHAAGLTRSVRRPVGLAELFVRQVAALHGDFPRFFAAIDGTDAVLADAPHIGVTLDLGEGLYVPCVRDAAALTMAEIATRLMKYRIAATTGTFRESDLGGANFVITLHTEGDVVLAIPFVFPGTVCALAVTSPADGSPANIGLAYDHRLINGRDASLFLHALKTSMEGLA